jgi:hypothetical protein
LAHHPSIKPFVSENEYYHDDDDDEEEEEEEWNKCMQTSLVGKMLFNM